MALFRKAVWFYKSWQDYTQAGYLESAIKFCESDLSVDLKGKSFMITGKHILINNIILKTIDLGLHSKFLVL